jgi:thiamine biosynthesis lipoprotein
MSHKNIVSSVIITVAICCAVVAFALFGGGALPGAGAKPGMGAQSAADLPVAHSREFFMLDTFIEIAVYSEDEAVAESTLDAAEEIFARVDRLMSRFDGNSDIYRINHAEPGSEPASIDAETFCLIKRALEYCEQSGGAFDIGLGAVSDLWDFNAADAGARVPPEPDLLAVAVAAGGYKKIEVDESKLAIILPPGMSIDLGSIAKGYATQVAADAIRDKGIANALVNAGGNVYALGEKPGAGSAGAVTRKWKVGIRHPRGSQYNDLLAAVSVSDQAVVTSGDYERYYEYDGVRYHHILDPSDGKPAGECISVTIICGDSALADYLSTAVFVLGPERGLALVSRYPGAEALIMTSDMEVVTSAGLDSGLEIYR